jgi:hypothetical protein
MKIQTPPWNEWSFVSMACRSLATQTLYGLVAEVVNGEPRIASFAIDGRQRAERITRLNDREWRDLRKLWATFEPFSLSGIEPWSSEMDELSLTIAAGERVRRIDSASPVPDGTLAALVHELGDAGLVGELLDALDGEPLPKGATLRPLSPDEQRDWPFRSV